ncbi:hypothetical protein Pla52o_04860 [Novipirellula galeiformis]|uniref:DUF4159 domain-containing protein n=1 Tax=Novipirellula galeiformis TaxID=2528004 RepID=A0A5C6CNU5_9BACT|nr:DUF4159 domain-containing protein [Novipirellula galeiformis]TWU26633.1 hypothetical protein Pla52o_04860 [Novipirellula galeiformis]
MNAVNRFRKLSPPAQWTIGYLAVWLLLLFELRTVQWFPLGIHVLYCVITIPLGMVWFRRARITVTSDTLHPLWESTEIVARPSELFVGNETQSRVRQTPPRWRLSQRERRYLVASVIYVLWWHLALLILDLLVWDAARASLARVGMGALFFIGLMWVVWGIERASTFYAQTPLPEDGKRIWNPLDLRAWFYAVQWWPPPLGNLLSLIRHPNRVASWKPSMRNRKLDQSFVALLSYSFAFLLLSLLFSQLRGCREIYEMPAGGGEQKQLAQVVKIKKVIRKKYVVNPLSAIRFAVPPIDEVQLKLMEITEHAYTVGFGEGKGAGFSEGTFRGKVRLIRLEYSGGDWDQDFGIGGDLNMLLEYGIRTSHHVAEQTESRTISQLHNFPIGKSPPLVYMTGQQNISLSSSEVKTMREYLVDKHGMLFADNGGSRHFHNQFIAMMNRVLPDVQAVPIPLDDVIHRIPYQIPYLPYVAPHGGKEALGWYRDGRWLAYYHPGDIGDAWADGHAGVNADIWESCYRTGTNVIFYAHAEYSKWLEAQNKD